MFEATIFSRFSAGHRLLNHAGKCRFPHGHSYGVEVSVKATNIGDTDWIEDFSVLKDVTRRIIEDHLDHAFILDSRDTSLIQALEGIEPVKLYILEQKAPTAERIAEALLHLIQEEVPIVCRVRVWETEVQNAAFIPEPA